jgi:hypothetical protein
MGWLPVSQGAVLTVTYTVHSNTCLVQFQPVTVCLCKLLGSESGVVEDSVLPGCDLLVVLVPDILKDDDIFVFSVRQSMTHLTLKVKGLQYFEKAGNTQLETCNITRDLIFSLSLLART